MTQHDIIHRPIVHRGQVDGRPVPEQTLTQCVPPGSKQLTDSVTLRQSRTLAVVRDGGLGDMLLLTPTLRALHTHYPHVDIHLFTKPPYLPVFDHNPHVAAVYPLHQYRKFAFDEVVDLQQFAERAPDADVLDRASLFASAFGLELEDGVLEYTVTEDEQQWARAWVGDSSRPLMAVAPFATDPRRCWPVSHALDFIRLMGDWDTIVIHDKEEAEDYFGRDARCCVSPTIRQKAAILAQCDMVVSADTGIYHLAVASRAKLHGAPFIVPLFGLIPPALRTKWYSNCLSLIADEVDCCPCGENPDLLQGCRHACMQALTGERVADNVRKLAEWKVRHRD